MIETPRMAKVFAQTFDDPPTIDQVAGGLTALADIVDAIVAELPLEQKAGVLNRVMAWNPDATARAMFSLLLDPDDPDDRQSVKDRIDGEPRAD